MRLPPLNALRAFEAAARHEGFINAADELHVTRGAISRHVKQLEAHLGVALFHRRAQGVQLTDAGRRLQPVLAEAFGLMHRETERITADARDLHVLCPPATSIRWLIPRLDAFHRRHPDIRVQLTTNFHSAVASDDDYDISFSVEHWPGRSAGRMVQPLFPVMLTPACAPRLADRLRVPADLAKLALLHETPRHSDWDAWLKTFAVPGVSSASGHDFPNLDMAVKAAVMGAGVVMADLVLCREELRSGALVTAFAGMVCPASYGAICLLGAQERWNDPKLVAFRSWALEAAEEDRAELKI